MIFTVNNDTPSITLEGVYIPEFTKVWKDSENPQNKLAFIYHYCQSQHNPTNPYYNLSPEDRIKILKKDYIEDEEWSLEEDEIVQNAIDKYNTLIPTASSAMLKSAEITAHRLSEYFSSVDFNKTKIDKEGNEIDFYDPKKIVDTLKNLSGVVKTIQELRLQVAKEWEGNKGKLKGSQTLSIFDE